MATNLQTALVERSHLHDQLISARDFFLRGWLFAANSVVLNAIQKRKQKFCLWSFNSQLRKQADKNWSDCFLSSDGELVCWFAVTIDGATQRSDKSAAKIALNFLQNVPIGGSYVDAKSIEKWLASRSGLSDYLRKKQTAFAVDKTGEIVIVRC